MKHELSKAERIWRTAAAIPKGKVASYGQVADLAGLPGRARMVGKALGTAPKSANIPWHRILKSDGRLAFAVGDQLAEKQKGLLQDEEIVVIKNKVNMQKFGWRPDLGELLSKLEF